MFALGIRYLNDWAMASGDGAKKETAEWPPHPDRIFMALAAGHFETDEDPSERAVLEWLEQLGSPSLQASDAEFRRVVISYVPVNDSPAPVKTDKAYQVMGALGIGRNRQPRSFPTAIPHDPVVHLIWGTDLPEIHHAPLQSLCRKVTSVGHSASFVQMWITDSPPVPNLIPVEGFAKRRLRVSGKGRLRYLEERFNKEAVLSYADFNSRISMATSRQKKALLAERDRCFPAGPPRSLRPEAGLWQGYGTPQPQQTPVDPRNAFHSSLVIMALSGRQYGLRSARKLVEALRTAVISLHPVPVPEWISGLTPEGQPSRIPHLAFLPLAFVGSEHADGRILGLALAIPRQAPTDEVSLVLKALFRFNALGLPEPLRLFQGEWLECALQLEQRESPPVTLRPDTWVGPARRWASVTPVVLDRHIHGKEPWEQAAEVIKTSCERIGLPRPLDVSVHPVSPLIGTPRSTDFPPFIRTSDGARLEHIHALITFDGPVTGPLVIGAGRYRGYGLCRPLPEGGIIGG